MKKVFTQRLLLAAIMMVAGAGNLLADNGDAFKATSVEGVDINFKVIDEEAKTCMVSGGVDASIPAIDKEYSGKVTIPDEALGYTVTAINGYSFFNCSMTEVVIPSSVTEIGDWTFFRCPISEVVIPLSVTKMGKMVFRECTKLTKCILPDNLEVVGHSFFYGCTSLKEVYLPSKAKIIGGSAFWKCESLEEIVIPASVDTLGGSAFDKCSSLKTVVFLGEKCPVSDKYIGVFNSTPYTKNGNEYISNMTVWVPSRSACAYDEELTVDKKQFNHGNPNIVHGLETAPTEFMDRSALGSMVSYDILYNAEKGAYEATFLSLVDDAQLTEVSIPEKIRDYNVTDFISYMSDKYRTDASMNALKKIAFPPTLRRIFNYALCNCSNLEEVEISDGLAEIGYGVFSGTSVRELRFPRTLKDYWFGAVKNCGTLTDVYLPCWKLRTHLSDYGPSASQAKLHVQFATLDAYQDWDFVDPYGTRVYEFDKSVEMDPVDGDIFYYPYKDDLNMTFQIISHQDNTCRVYGENMKYETTINYETEGNVNIPKKARGYDVVEIGDYAFGHASSQGVCSKISYVNIPNTIKRIGEMAFARCENLVLVTFSNSLEEIGPSAFWRASKIANVSLPEGLKVIGDMAFNNCPSLEIINLPEGLTKLGYAALGYTAINAIDIPGSVENIEDHCFDYCTLLESVTIAEGVKTVGEKAFYNCESLTAIDLPSTAGSIGYQAFKNCMKLADVKIRNGCVLLLDEEGTMSDDNEAFDLKTERYAELSVPKETYEHYSQDPWFLWFNKIKFELPAVAATGIEPADVVSDAIPSRPIYDLQGRLMNGPLKSGIYIRDGKKVLVK